MELKSILRKNKKGMTLGDIYPAVLTLVLIGIILGIGLYVMTQVGGQIKVTTPSTAINTTISGIAGFADWIAVIVVVIAAAIVLGIVLSSFGRGAGV